MKKRLLTGFAAVALFSALGTSTTNFLPQTTTVKAATTAAQSKFLKTAAKKAQKVSKKYGLYPSVMIAQAIVESDWGQSSLAVNANNLFGMKADDKWTGATYSSPTREESNSKSYYVTAKFRKYSSYQGSFDDNGKKLREGVSWQPLRYQGAWLEKASSYKAATKALTGTYATDHNYNKTLNKQISANNLTKYDPKISKTAATYTANKNAATYAWPTNHSLSAKSGAIKKGDTVKVTKTITYYNGKKRMYISGKGWVNDTVLDDSSALPTVSQAPKNTSKTNKTLMHNAYVYDAKGKRVKGVKTLKSGNSGKIIATYGTKEINGKKYYQIADNQYVAAGNIDGSMRLIRHNAYVYNDFANRDNTRLVKKGESIATYGTAVKIYGKKYYRIGIGQYIKKANFSS